MGRSTSDSCCRVGSCLVHTDAVSTRLSIVPRTRNPVMAARWRRKRRQRSRQRCHRGVSRCWARVSVIVDARVDEDIRQIYQEIRQDEEG